MTREGRVFFREKYIPETLHYKTQLFEFRLPSTESVVCLLRWVERHMRQRESRAPAINCN